MGISEDEAEAEYNKIQTPFLFNMRESSIITAALSVCAEQTGDKEIKALHDKIKSTVNQSLKSSAMFFMKRRINTMFGDQK